MSKAEDVRVEREEIDLGEELDGAIDDMSEAVQAYTFDGDRSEAGAHSSGEPVRRGLVLGDDDPRDEGDRREVRCCIASIIMRTENQYGILPPLKGLGGFAAVAVGFADSSRFARPSGVPEGAVGAL